MLLGWLSPWSVLSYVSYSRLCYPRELFNVLGYIDLQVLKYGLMSILNHKFIIGALLPRQAHFTLR